MTEASKEELEREMHEALDAKAAADGDSPFAEVLGKIKAQRAANNGLNEDLRKAGVQVHPLQLFALRLDMLAATVLGEAALYDFELDFEEAAGNLLQESTGLIARAKLMEGVGTPPPSSLAI